MNFLTTSFDELRDLNACDEGLQALDDCMPPVYKEEDQINVLELPERMLWNGFAWYVRAKAVKLNLVTRTRALQLMYTAAAIPVLHEQAITYANALNELHPLNVQLGVPAWRLARLCNTCEDARALLEAFHFVFGEWEEA